MPEHLIAKERVVEAEELAFSGDARGEVRTEVLVEVEIRLLPAAERVVEHGQSHDPGGAQSTSAPAVQVVPVEYDGVEAQPRGLGGQGIRVRGCGQDGKTAAFDLVLKPWHPGDLAEDRHPCPTRRQLVAQSKTAHDVAEALDAVRTGPGQRLEVVSPTPDLAGLAATCDIAVTAAGSSVWEFLCLGVPAMLVCVVDNQAPGYDAVTGQDLAAPLGHLQDLRHDRTARDGAVAATTRLLDDPDRCAALSARGMALVDGLGRSRVADALLGAVASRR